MAESLVLPAHCLDACVSGLPIGEMQDRRSNKRIYVHNAEEIEGMRHAARIAREILDAGGRAVSVGVTCDEIDRVVHEATIERGAYPSPLNYHSFPKSVCTSVNEVRPRDFKAADLAPTARVMPSFQNR
eukprot:scaffold1166_cov261-Pinguiococcus_pyrenoidosus.AAC.18